MNERCNVLFIMADQFRLDALRHLGGVGRTRALDSLAAEGVSFRRAVTNSPECIPARFALATGLYPHQTGVWRNAPVTLSPSAWTWMQSLVAAGYRTSVFGKTHFHESAHPSGDLREGAELMRGLGLIDVDEIAGPRASVGIKCAMTDEWERLGLWEDYRKDLQERFAAAPWTAAPSPLGIAHYYDSYVGRRALDYLSSYDWPEPWCCWVSFAGPHEPWDAPAPYDTMHSIADMAPPTPRMEGWEKVGGLLSSLFRLPEHSAPHADSDIAALRANYAGNVTLIDDCIGELLDCLRAKSAFDKTLIIFTSDHGEMNGDQGLLYKSNFLSPAVDVPLVVKPPRRERAVAGNAADALIELIDAGATILDYAGAHSPQWTNGRSVRPLIEGASTTHRDYIVSEFAEHTMIATGSWKCEFDSEDRPILLFDRTADALEQFNLVEEPAERQQISELKNLLGAHRRATSTSHRIIL